MEKRLTLSANDKMIGGVCGGIGEYFKVDSTIIRIIIVLLFFIFPFAPIPIYILFWIIMPKKTIETNKPLTKSSKKYRDGFYDFSEFDE